VLSIVINILNLIITELIRNIFTHFDIQYFLQYKILIVLKHFKNRIHFSLYFSEVTAITTFPIGASPMLKMITSSRQILLNKSVSFNLISFFKESLIILRHFENIIHSSITSFCNIKIQMRLSLLDFHNSRRERELVRRR
jgi:hypothetical protein